MNKIFPYTFMWFAILSLMLSMNSSSFAQGGERLIVGKIPIRYSPFYNINDPYIERIPRLLKAAVDSGSYAVAVETRTQILMKVVKYKNRELSPSRRNMKVIDELYEELLDREKGLLGELCQDNGFDMLIYWDSFVDVSRDRVMVVIKAYFRPNNSVIFKQLELDREAIRDSNIMADKLAEYVKQFGDILVGMIR